ncbi:MAG: hypothetical protein ACT4QE_06545 [Anaerolineales bacterium]
MSDSATASRQPEQEEILQNYSRLIQKADDQVMTGFRGIMAQAQSALSTTRQVYWVKIAISAIVIVVALYLVIDGLGVFRTPDFAKIGIGTITGCVGVVLLLIYRDPLKNVRETVTRLAKVNIVMLGYIRQLNQIDVVFKVSFIAHRHEHDNAALQQSATVLQKAIQQTILSLEDYSIE